jgi:hypothetical protein
MKSTELRQLIRESINEYIRDIDEAGTKAGLQAKIEATEGAISKREKMAAMEGIDEAYHEMLDKGKMKEIGNEVKALKKSLDKLKKQLDKLNSKGTKTEKVEDKEIVDEVEIDETFPESGSQLEEAKNETAEKLFQMFKDEDLLDDRKEYDTEDLMSAYPGLSQEEANKLKNMLQSIDEMNIYEMLHMQKLAGIISETEYNAKVEEAKKNPSSGLTKKEKSAIAKKAHAGKDIGKKGKGFEDVAKAAGGGEKGKKIAAAAMWKGEAKKAKSLKEEIEALFENEMGGNNDKALGILFRVNDDKEEAEETPYIWDHDAYENLVKSMGYKDYKDIAGEMTHYFAPGDNDEMRVMRNLIGNPDLQPTDLTIGMYKKAIKNEYPS